MAVVGIGLDVAEISRIEKLEEAYGERFLARVYHPLERETLERFRDRRRGEFLAGRFACKEAAKKAIGNLPGRGIAWREIYVTNRSSGKPEIHFEGRAADLAGQLGICAGHVSISHDGGLAIAQVILESP